MTYLLVGISESALNWVCVHVKVVYPRLDIHLTAS